MTTAYLVLQDGSVFQGRAFGAPIGTNGPAVGEVVFNTSMTGYQEMLTDPSYAGQIVMPTFPLVGNYGINDGDVESRKVQVAGFVVREEWHEPSHYDSAHTLDQYLVSQGVTGLSGVDTRAITRRIRSQGVMMGTLTTGPLAEALKSVRSLPAYDAVNFVERVTVGEGYAWPLPDAGASIAERTSARAVTQEDTQNPPAFREAQGERLSAAGRRIAVVDCGVKYNILRLLAARGCQVRVLPATATADEVLAMDPNGVVFSPGPGDPVHNVATVETAKALIGRLPVLGICLGHQVVAMAMGARTYKLKFGHRGGNHPVQELETGLVSITAQNHGYAVADDGLPPELVVTHRNLNDGTVEGLRHRDAPVLTIQYHSEASPGPRDNEYLFDRWLEMVG